MNSLISCALCGIGRVALNALIANAPVSDESLRKVIAVCRAAESTPQQVLDTLRREKELLDARMAVTELAPSTEEHKATVKQFQAFQRLRDRLGRSLPEFLATEELRAQAESDESGYSNWRIQLGVTDFGLRATRLRAAIVLYQRKNGKLPETLVALCPGILPEVPLDPFSGKPIRYSETDEGWKIWGVGEDMRDDGGNATYSQKLGNFQGPDDVVLSGTPSELERRSSAFNLLSQDELDKALAAMLARKTPTPSELHDAVRKNDKALVERILAVGCDLNGKDWEGRTPLQVAIIAGRSDLAEYLVAKGADVNARDNVLRLTPLHYAANLGRQEIIQLLLEKGAAANAKASRGQTPLHLADSREAVNLLLEKKADIDARDSAGQTALHWASASGRLTVAELLIKGGADVNAKDNIGSPPLHDAARTGQIEVAKLLLANGAELNARTKQGITPIIAAVIAADLAFHNTAMVQFLLSKGVDRNDELYVAIQAKDAERVRAALAHGVQASGTQAFGLTPLGNAIRNDAGKAIVELLLARGADVNERDKLLPPGRTALYYAFICGRRDVIPLLLAKGAEPGAVDDEGNTPLHYAAERGWLEVVELLVAKGAHVNARDKAGSTPLRLAVKEDCQEVAKFLRAHGAKE